MFSCETFKGSYHVDSQVIRRFMASGAAGMGPKSGRTHKPNARGKTRQAGLIRACLGIFLLLPEPAFAADAAGADFLLIAVTFASGALGLAGCLWALSEFQSSRHVRRALKTATAKARLMI